MNRYLYPEWLSDGGTKGLGSQFSADLAAPESNPADLAIAFDYADLDSASSYLDGIDQASPDGHYYGTSANVGQFSSGIGASVPETGIVSALNTASTSSVSDSVSDSATTTDTLTVYLSGDAFQGNAAGTVTVNGVQVGGVLTTSAVNSLGQVQAFTLTGSFGPNPVVALTFINDAGNGQPGDDRNLYLDGFAYDGVAQLGDQAALYYDHSVTYTLTSTPTPAERTATFINATGVAIHLDYLNTSYANFSLVQSALKYLGATDLRVGVPTKQTLPEMQTLAAEGFKFDVLMPEIGTDALLASNLGSLHQFGSSIAAIEGPNEANLFNATWDGQTGAAGAVAYQEALWAAVQADPVLNTSAVYALSLGAAPPSEIDEYGDLSPYSTYGNMHVYYVGNEPPASELQFNLSLDAIDNPGEPAVITETNYATAPALGGVTDAVQASYDVDLLMDAAKDGIATTYFYELLDWQSDPGQTNVEFHEGLFNADGTPKPAATGIHNLMSILADPGANAATFTPGALRYTVTGLPASGDTFLLEKSSGVFDLAVWAEPTLWNTTTETAITAPSLPVQVSLAGTVASVLVFDPLVGTAPIAQYTNVSSIPITITDHPLILQISQTALNQSAVASTVSPQTVAFGNHHVGDVVSRALSIGNTAPTGSEALDAGIGAATGGITATGSFTGLAAGATDSTHLTVGLNTASTGAKAGTATVTLSSDGTGIDSRGITALGTQTVGVTGAVYAYAAPMLSATTLNLGAARVGAASLAQSLTLADGSSASPFQEALVYGASTPAGFAWSSAAGTIASGSNATLGLSLATGTAGSYTGSATLALTSTGVGTSGLASTALPGQALSVTGKVYAAAVAQISATSINFGVVHVGDTVSQSLSLTNAATGALTDSLTGGTASLSGAAGPVGFALGNGLASGASGTVGFGLNTASSGQVSGSAVLGFTSHDPDLADLAINGGTVTVTGTVDAYAAMGLIKTGGVGTLTQTGNNYTLNFGTWTQQAAGAVTVGFGVKNIAAGVADLLSGNITSTGGNSFTDSKLTAFSGLGAGTAYTAPTVTFSTSTVGTFTETITLSGTGSNASGYSAALAPETLTIIGTVVPNVVMNTGSNGADGAVGADGGVGQAASATANSAALAVNSASALGGIGGAGGAGGDGGSGGGAQATATTVRTTSTASSIAKAAGGAGGSASGAGDTGGAGGTAAGSTASASGGGLASASVTQTGGGGGAGTGGASGGGGAASQLTNAVSGSTNGGTLSLTQIAIGGNGGTSDTGHGGGAGSAVSSLTFDDRLNPTASAAITANVAATGGNGGASAGTDGNGGFGNALANITGAGAVTLRTTATGGATPAGGGAGGTATATSIATGTQVNDTTTANAGIGQTIAATAYANAQATGTSGTISAIATTGLGAGNLIIGESAIATAAVQGTSNVLAEAEMGESPPWWGVGAEASIDALPTAATLAPVLASAPNTQAVFGAGTTVLGIGQVGGGHSPAGTTAQTSTASADITLDRLQLAGTPDLFLSFYKAAASYGGVSDVSFNLSANGTTLLTEDFSSLASAITWFTDHPLDLGSLATGVLAQSATLDVHLGLSVTTTSGGAFSTGFLIGEAPASTHWPLS